MAGYTETDWPVQPGDDWTRVSFLTQLWDALRERHNFEDFLRYDSYRENGYGLGSNSAGRAYLTHTFENMYAGIDPQNIQLVASLTFANTNQNRAQCSIWNLLFRIYQVGEDYTTVAEATRWANALDYNYVFGPGKNQFTFGPFSSGEDNIYKRFPLKNATQMALEEEGWPEDTRFQPFFASNAYVGGLAPVEGTIARVRDSPYRLQRFTNNAWVEIPREIDVGLPPPTPVISTSEQDGQPGNPYGFLDQTIDGQDTTGGLIHRVIPQFMPTAEHFNLARKILDNCQALRYRFPWVEPEIETTRLYRKSHTEFQDPNRPNEDTTTVSTFDDSGIFIERGDGTQSSTRYKEGESITRLKQDVSANSVEMFYPPETDVPYDPAIQTLCFHYELKEDPYGDGAGPHYRTYEQESPPTQYGPDAAGRFLEGHLELPLLDPTPYSFYADSTANVEASIEVRSFYRRETFVIPNTFFQYRI